MYRRTFVILNSNADPWALLGVQRGTPVSQVKSAYHRLAKQYHPDVNPGGEKKFQAIKKAYEAVTQAQKIARGISPEKKEGAPSDILRGQVREVRRRRPKRDAYAACSDWRETLNRGPLSGTEAADYQRIQMRRKWEQGFDGGADRDTSIAWALAVTFLFVVPIGIRTMQPSGSPPCPLRAL
eukprot:Hpha_TRINITY_DN24976_c0_g1::TRINITY_DN24976_c0_g1_i1::g.111129::m.111129